MQGDNVVQFPGGHQQASSPMMGQLLDRLIKRFREGGKRQREVFERLSIFVEELEKEIKKTYGLRSGKISRAYDDHYMAMKSRFSAKSRVPPRPLFSTPDGWLVVLRGFAREMGRNEHALLAVALERAFQVSDSGSAVALGDYAETFVLLDAMKNRVSESINLVAINDYVRRSGLYLERETVEVAEWPSDDAGYIDGMIYNASAFAFVPRVFGLNALTVAEIELEPADLENEEFAFLRPFEPDLRYETIHLLEARLVGIAIAVNASSDQAEIALLEWDNATAIFNDCDGTVLHSVDVITPQGNAPEAEVKTAGLGIGLYSPEDWHPSGIRIHFKGSDGFNRLLQSTLVRPWIYSELNPEFWHPTPEDHITFPVSTPVHTVAACIEGNILYADVAGRSDQRLDRLLLSSARQIEALLTRYREQGEVIRRPRRDAILSEWENGDGKEIPTEEANP